MRSLLTNSRLKAARLCPMYHHLRYVEGWQPVDKAPPLAFGTAFHLGMEHYWKGQPFPAAKDLLPDSPFDNARVQALLAGYRARWEGEDSRYEVLGVEVEFQTPLVHPVTGEISTEWILSGKLDLIVRDRMTGEVLVVEHKTSGEDISVGSMYWSRLGLDTQILIYNVGARALGYEPAATLYDVAMKPRQRPRKAETAAMFRERIASEIAANPAAYYARARLTRFEGEVNAALLDAWAFAERMSQGMKDGWRPRNPDACFKYGRACDFYGVCSGTDVLMEGPGCTFAKGPINPELGNQEAA